MINRKQHSPSTFPNHYPAEETPISLNNSNLNSKEENNDDSSFDYFTNNDFIDLSEESFTTLFDAFKNSLDTISSSVRVNNAKLKEKIDIQTEFSRILTYLSVNRENLFYFFQPLCPSSIAPFIKNNLDLGNDFFKWISLFSETTFLKFQLSKINHLKARLEKLSIKRETIEKNYKEMIASESEDFQELITDCDRRIEEIEGELEKKEIALSTNSFKKNFKLIAKVVVFVLENFFPLMTTFSFPYFRKSSKRIFSLYNESHSSSQIQKTIALLEQWEDHLEPKRLISEIDPLLLEEEKIFFADLSEQKSMMEVKTFLSKAKIEKIKLPKRFENWKKLLKNDDFILFLKKEFYLHHSSIPNLHPNLCSMDDLKSNLSKEKKLFDQDIDHLMHKISLELAHASSGISRQNWIDTNIFPKSILERDELKKVTNHHLSAFLANYNEQENGDKIKFCSLLAHGVVEHQRTVGQLLKAGLFAPLNKRIVQEKQFLQYKKIESFIEVIYAILSLSLSIFSIFPAFNLLCGDHFLVDFFISHGKKNLIAKNPSLNWIYLIDPTLKFKMINIFLNLTECIVGLWIKPNEYSKEAYIYSFKIYFITLTQKFDRLDFFIREKTVQASLFILEKVSDLNHSSRTKTQKLFSLEQEKKEQFAKQKKYLKNLLPSFKIGLEQSKRQFKEQVNRLNDKLNQLKIKDVDSLQDPNHHLFTKIIEEQLRKEQKIDYFSKEVHSFFRQLAIKTDEGSCNPVELSQAINGFFLKSLFNHEPSFYSL